MGYYEEIEEKLPLKRDDLDKIGEDKLQQFLEITHNHLSEYLLDTGRIDFTYWKNKPTINKETGLIRAEFYDDKDNLLTFNETSRGIYEIYSTPAAHKDDASYKPELIESGISLEDPEYSLLSWQSMQHGIIECFKQKLGDGFRLTSINDIGEDENDLRFNLINDKGDEVTFVSRGNGIFDIFKKNQKDENFPNEPIEQNFDVFKGKEDLRAKFIAESKVDLKEEKPVDVTQPQVKQEEVRKVEFNFGEILTKNLGQGKFKETGRQVKGPEVSIHFCAENGRKVSIESTATQTKFDILASVNGKFKGIAKFDAQTNIFTKTPHFEEYNAAPKVDAKPAEIAKLSNQPPKAIPNPKNLLQLCDWAADEAGINRDKFRGLVYLESRFIHNNVSFSGCTGLGQFSAGTFNEVVRKYNLAERYPGIDWTIDKTDARKDPVANALASAFHTKQNLDRTGGTDYTKAYVIHNLGSGMGPKFLHELKKTPNQTIDVAKFCGSGKDDLKNKEGGIYNNGGNYFRDPGKKKMNHPHTYDGAYDLMASHIENGAKAALKSKVALASMNFDMPDTPNRTMVAQESKERSKDNQNISKTHYTISGGANVKDLKQEAAYALNVLAKEYKEATGDTLRVTSGVRSPHGQAKAMYDNMVAKGAGWTNIYRDKEQAQEVMEAFREKRGVAGIEKVLNKYIDKGRYLSTHMSGLKYDIGTAGLDNPKKFCQIASQMGFKVINEGNHFDLEFKDNGNYRSFLAKNGYSSGKPESMVAENRKPDNQIKTPLPQVDPKLDGTLPSQGEANKNKLASIVSSTLGVAIYRISEPNRKSEIHIYTIDNKDVAAATLAKDGKIYFRKTDVAPIELAQAELPKQKPMELSQSDKAKLIEDIVTTQLSGKSVSRIDPPNNKGEINIYTKDDRNNTAATLAPDGIIYFRDENIKPVPLSAGRNNKPDSQSPSNKSNAAGINTNEVKKLLDGIEFRNHSPDSTISSNAPMVAKNSQQNIENSGKSDSSRNV